MGTAPDVAAVAESENIPKARVYAA